MKKLFVISFALMSIMNAFAQQEVGTFTVQPKVGLNVANFTGSTDQGISRSPRIGLAAGIEFEYRCTFMSISLGVLYSMQGAKGSTMLENVKLNATDKLNYINIPIMANFYVTKDFALKVGFQPAIKVSDGYKISAQGQSLSGKLSDWGFEFNTFDFSIPVGLSYEFYNVVIDARYNIGITKVEKDAEGQNSIFQFTLGYKFRL